MSLRLNPPNYLNTR